MPEYVLKFGGSSLGRPERLARALGLIRREHALHAVELVVSAFGDTTDDLIAAAHAAAERRLDAALPRVDRLVNEALRVAREAAGDPLDAATTAVAALDAELRELLGGIAVVGDLSPVTRDAILSFGERISSQLVAAALTATGLPAIAVDARTWMVTDDRHGDATVIWEPTVAALNALPETTALRVHTGFLGRTVAGRTTTLGRNGSDYTAALLARARQAKELHVWTDVSGVMTADPSLVDEAYPVTHLSYREALELAGLGLRMLHPRTVLPLLASGIPMRIRSTLAPDAPGTRVAAEGSTDIGRPTCVTSLEDMTLLDVEGTQATASAQIGPRASGALATAGVPVWFETQAPRGNGIALVVADADADRAAAAVHEALGRELARGDLAPPRLHRGVTLLTLVAEAMGQTVNVAGRFFGALGIAGVNVRAASQGATSRAISCVVDGAETPVAVRAVHAAMNLAREQVSVFLLGKGTVGRQLLAQLGAEQARLRARHDVELRLVGVADRAHVRFEPRGLQPEQALARLDTAHGGDLSAQLDAFARLPVPVLVDCTAADGMEALYAQAFARGIHVVAANKKPLALPGPARDAIFAAARAAHRAYRYETTVGASLPVIETVKNLVRTGDHVLLIEGSLSGTLGYLSNEVTRGTPLSVAVAEAHRRGYTEPHPREDLGGVDAARKALILARELGLEVELSQVEVTPFVDAALLEHDELDAFFAALSGADAAFAERVAALRARGEVLRYLAQIDPGDAATGRAPSLKVGPVGVPADHPATRLRGTEAFVAFTTARYREYPLVVQGAGAGGAVTAAGVLADVLALSQGLRGR
jgi:aspartokinase/homoserine dehydrogenase 1